MCSSKFLLQFSLTFSLFTESQNFLYPFSWEKTTKIHRKRIRRIGKEEVKKPLYKKIDVVLKSISSTDCEIRILPLGVPEKNSKGGKGSTKQKKKKFGSEVEKLMAKGKEKENISINMLELTSKMVAEA
ncbi:hypothetical protein TNCV_2656951 [Trichonephila clavipes]|nr:hypothetical protein TNCV_2656951 [Trichonephila clavipes]